MAESYSVQAMLSAIDKNFSSTFEDIARTANAATNSISQGLSTIGKVSAIAGTAITAMGVTSLKSFGDFQASLNKAAVVAGGTSKDIQGLADVANKMGADLPLSAQDAADAMVQMAQDGANLETIKDEFPAIAKAATAAGADLQATAGTVQVAMNIWGDSIGSSAQAAAVLTETANVSNATIEEMKQVFADVGSIAEEVGFSMQDTATAVGLVTNAGVPAAQAAQDLNYALTRMIKPTKTASDMAASLGISYYDAQGRMKSLPSILAQIADKTSGLSDEQKQLALTTMYGTAGFKAMGPLLKGITSTSDNASQSWSAMSAAINDASSSAEAANAVLDAAASEMQKNIGSKLEQVGGNWEALRNTAMQSSSGINGSILDVVNNILGMANDSNSALGSMAQSFIGMSTVIGPAMTGFSGFAAQANAVRNFLGLGAGEGNRLAKTLSSLGNTKQVAGGFAALENSASALTAKLKEAPAVMNNLKFALNGVEKLGKGGFTELSKGSQVFIDTIATGAGSVRSFGTNAKWAVNSIGSGVDGVVAKIPVIGTMFTQVKGVIGTTAAGITSSVGGAIRGLPGEMGAAATDMTAKFPAITGAFSQMGANISSVTSKISSGVTQTFSRFGPQISGGISAGMSVGTSMLQSSITTMMGVMRAGLSALAPASVIALLLVGMGAANNQFGTQINDMLTTAMTKGPQIITNLVNGIVTAIPQLMASGETMMTSLLNAITANLPAIIQGGVNIVTTLVTSMVSGANSGSMLNAAIQMITTLVTSLVTAMPQLISAGITLVMALVQALIDNLPMLITAAITMIQTLAQGLMENMDQIINGALQLVTALAQGINDNLPQLIQMAAQIIVSLVTGMSDHIDQIINAALTIMTTLVTSLIDNLPQIIEAALQLIVALANGIIDNLPKIIEAGLKLLVQLVTSLIQNAPQLVGAAIQMIASLAGGIIDHIPDMLQALLNVGSYILEQLKKINLIDVGVNLIKGLWKGINSVKDWILEKIGGFGKSIVKGIKGFFGIKSPSRLMNREVGKYIAMGVGTGISDYTRSAVASAVEMSDRIASAVNPQVSLTGLSDTVSAANQALNQQMSANVSGEMSLVRQPANIMLTMGNHTYNTYVDDLSSAQDARLQLGSKYRLRGAN